MADTNWRVRLGMLEAISTVSCSVTYYLFVQHFEPLFMLYLNDSVSSIRLKGAKSVEVAHSHSPFHFLFEVLGNCSSPQKRMGGDQTPPKTPRNHEQGHQLPSERGSGLHSRVHHGLRSRRRNFRRQNQSHFGFSIEKQSAKSEIRDSESAGQADQDIRRPFSNPDARTQDVDLKWCSGIIMLLVSFDRMVAQLGNDPDKDVKYFAGQIGKI